MRHEIFKLTTLLMLSIVLTRLHAQTMFVKQANGTQTAYALSNLLKMTFSGGYMTVSKTDNTNGVYALCGLRYLNFTDLTSSLEEPLIVQKELLNVYPNPVSNKLNINITGTNPSNGVLSIFNFEGKAVFSQQINQAETLIIDISDLPKSIYLCQYRNATEQTTVKIIKQ